MKKGKIAVFLSALMLCMSVTGCGLSEEIVEIATRNRTDPGSSSSERKRSEKDDSSMDEEIYQTAAGLIDKWMSGMLTSDRELSESVLLPDGNNFGDDYSDLSNFDQYRMPQMYAEKVVLSKAVRYIEEETRLDTDNIRKVYQILTEIELDKNNKSVEKDACSFLIIKYGKEWYLVPDGDMFSWDYSKGRFVINNGSSDEKNTTYGYYAERSENGKFSFLEPDKDGKVKLSNGSVIELAPSSGSEPDEYTDDGDPDDNFSNNGETVIVTGYSEAYAQQVQTQAENINVQPVTQAAERIQDASLWNVTNITASSCRDSEYADKAWHYYDPDRLIDGDYDSCWCEGADGPGTGESFTVNFDGTCRINEIYICSGLAASEELYYKNGRPRKMTAYFSDGSSFKLDFDDGYDCCEHYFTLERPVNSKWVKFVIDDVYSGNKYDDTCITEIDIY